MAAGSGGEFEYRVALVTGGTSGIGEAVVRALAGRGARVVFCGLHDAPGAELEAELRGAGADARYARADVREDAQMGRLVGTALERYGRLDCAVNNAGISHPPVRLAEIEPAVYGDVMRTNADGVFYAMRHELRQLMEQGTGGAIVNVASVAGIRGFGGTPPYVASKHAVQGLCDSLRMELRGSGVGVLTVMASGALLLSACVAVNLAGTGFAHFWSALALLGVGWNFLFVGATTLLTEAYAPAEKAKAQGVNDLLVFSMVALTAFSSGALHAAVGWTTLNLAVLPALLLVAAACAALGLARRRGAAAPIAPGPGPESAR